MFFCPTHYNVRVLVIIKRRTKKICKKGRELKKKCENICNLSYITIHYINRKDSIQKQFKVIAVGDIAGTTFCIFKHRL